MKKITLLATILFYVITSNAQVVVSTVAGSTEGYADGNSTVAQFKFPYGVCSDAFGNKFVVDRDNQRIRKISPTGIVSTIAGSGVSGYVDGIGTSAQFNFPSGIAVDGAGNVYIADSANNRIRKISTSGSVTTIAGSTSGFADGIGITAKFNNPTGISIDNTGNILVVDNQNNRIRKISTTGLVSTLAGSTPGYNDGIGSAAQFYYPVGICTDTSGNSYIADSSSHRIRKITPSGIVTTIAGNSVLGNTGGYADGIGTSAFFSYPYGIAVDTSGNLYVADSGNSRVRKITPTGVVTTIVGILTDGTGNIATFYSPQGICTDSSNNILVADTYNHKIRKIVICNSSNSPVTSITASPNANTICQGQSITLFATGGDTYLWGNGNTNSSLTVNPLTTTTYSVTATNIYGCTATASKTITVNPLPTITISPTSPITCSGQNITLTANGGTSYVWSNGAIGSSVIVAPTTNTTYSVTGTDLNGCSTNVSKAVNIYSTPLTNISADGVIATSTTINNGSSVQLQLNGSFNAVPNIQWSPATGIGSTTASNPVVYPSNTTTYTASFTNSNGCQQSTSFVVNVNPQPTIGTLSLTSTSSAAIGLFDTITVDVQLTGATNLYSLFMKLKGNAAVNQYLDYQGFTASTLLGSGSSVISTPPTVSNGVADFGITKVGASSGYSGSGVYYTMRFAPKNISIPDGTVFCFYIDDVNAYNSSGTPCGLNNQGQICYTFTNQVNVWPGDLNNTKTVTTADLLPIGYFYNATGPTRTNTSIQWNPQPVTLWGYNHSSQNGDAYKVFADSNGDGVINNADQAAIGFNMNQVHARHANSKPFSIAPNTQRSSLAVGGLTITPNATIINAATLPQTVTFTINLNNTGGLNALYGISVNLIFDNTIFDLNTTSIDYTGSIFGIAGSDCLVMNYNSANAVSVGLTRYANATINGQGLLFKVTLQTKSSVGSSLTQTPVTAYVDSANNQAGNTLVIQDAPVTNFTIINNLGIKDIKQDEFVLYPNPTNDILYLSIEKNIDQFENLKLIVFNTLGQIVNEIPVKNSNTQISTRNWGASGVYFVQITNSNNTVLTSKKVLLVRK
ncbi:Secretion system C-terminal sorting domain [Flavobacteriaceae bacterium]